MRQLAAIAVAVLFGVACGLVTLRLIVGSWREVGEGLFPRMRRRP